MSVLIKGMEMPKDGVYWCEIGVAGDIATITIHGEDRKSFSLVSIPDGRLNDDTISRQAAIDALWEALYEYEDKIKKQFQESDELDVEDWILHRVFVQNMNDIDRHTILDLPSAQPEWKVGKWNWDFADNGWADWTCSICGWKKNTDIHVNLGYNYCPNCGARMEGEEG